MAKVTSPSGVEQTVDLGSVPAARLEYWRRRGFTIDGAADAGHVPAAPAGGGPDDGLAVSDRVAVQQGFDPGEHTVAEVKARLRDADDDERARILQVEAAGKARASLVGA